MSIGSAHIRVTLSDRVKDILHKRYAPLLFDVDTPFSYATYIANVNDVQNNRSSAMRSRWLKPWLWPLQPVTFMRKEMTAEKHAQVMATVRQGETTLVCDDLKIARDLVIRRSNGNQL